MLSGLYGAEVCNYSAGRRLGVQSDCSGFGGTSAAWAPAQPYATNR